MKNKNVYIIKMIRSFSIFIFLLILTSKNPDKILKLIMFPFLFCSLFSIGQNICMIINKKNFSIIFHKLFVVSFLIFWFGFLIFGSSFFIKEKNIFLLIFTIPFWLSGIHITRKFLFNVNKNY